MQQLVWFIFLCLSVCIGSCSSHRQLAFADEEWKFSYKTGHIVNNDSTIRFTFGDKILNPEMTLVSCADSLNRYPGADRYIADILATCGLSDSKILFYSPVEQTLWVELPDEYSDCKPRAISYNLTDPLPGTAWVWSDDVHPGRRKPQEIYSNAYVNRKSGFLLVVDKLTYGGQPMACIHVFQSENKRTQRLGFRPGYWANRGNMTDISYIDMLSNWIDGRRGVIFENYRLGVLTEHRREVNCIREELRRILELDQEPRNRIVKAWREQPSDTLLHQSIAREIVHNDSVNLSRVIEILESNELEFGEENEVLWGVIQHSTLELQQKYLPKFIEAARRGDLKGEYVAVMQDRVACQSGRPQIYGSQGNMDEYGRFVPVEIENPENVDARRAAMGMISLEEYINRMSERPR